MLQKTYKIIERFSLILYVTDELGIIFMVR
jgi:hypothetical protein